MLIGIDASRATVARRTGTEGYSLHVIRAMIAQGGDHRFRLYFRDQPPPDLFPAQDNVESVILRRRRMWTHRALGPAVIRDRPDVLFVPAHVIPWPGVGGVPSVVTVHDLGYLHYPDKHPFFSRLYLDWSTRHSVALARRVIAVSKATAHDLMALYGTPQDKIRVVYSGVDPALAPVAKNQQVEGLRRQLGINGPYILHVGSVQPRKNLSRLIEAFARIRDTLPGLQLVLAGNKSWGYGQIEESVRHFELNGQVVMPGYISDADLPALYSGALVYAFPSLYEGFGFPALEAMACGTAVVCASASSLPEVVGDSALAVAPTDIDGWATALRRVLTDETLRDDLRRRGLQQVRSFTWDSCARATLDVLQETASLGRPPQS